MKRKEKREHLTYDAYYIGAEIKKQKYIMMKVGLKATKENNQDGENEAPQGSEVIKKERNAFLNVANEPAS